MPDSEPESARNEMDTLLADTVEPSSIQVLDFVRIRMRKLKDENRQLKIAVDDLSQTLAILQTAQNYGTASGNLPNEEKMKEVALLLMEAKKAKQEAMEFSKVGKAQLYEKLRMYKNMLYRERIEKREMKDRLKNSFEHLRILKEQNAQKEMKRKLEREAWQTIVRRVKHEHQKEMKRFRDDSLTKEDKARQMGKFGERVMHELQQLQVHLDNVKKETVDQVDFDALDEMPASAPPGASADDSLPHQDSAAYQQDKDNQFFITQR